MSLADHLRELRRRIIIIAAALVLGMVAGWFVTPLVWDLLRGPVEHIATAQGRQVLLNYVDITSAFDLKLRISFFLGLVGTSPIWLYQIWAYVNPGLKPNERRLGLGFLAVAVPLFLAGCFAGWLVLPNIIALMTGFVPQQDASYITATFYFDFVMRLILVVGVAFVVPVFLVALNFAGVLSAATILHGWRMAILAITIFTAAATPAADVVSMFLLAIPMVLLYFGAVGIAALSDRRRARRQQRELATLPELSRSNRDEPRGSRA